MQASPKQKKAHVRGRTGRRWLIGRQGFSAKSGAVLDSQRGRRVLVAADRHQLGRHERSSTCLASLTAVAQHLRRGRHQLVAALSARCPT